MTMYASKTPRDLYGKPATALMDPWDTPDEHDDRL